MSTDLTVEDVLDVEYPSPPAWSADGRFVATRGYEDDGHTLHVATTDDATPHAGFDTPSDNDAASASDTTGWRLSPGEGHVAAIAWAPGPTPNRLALVTDDGDLFLVNAVRGTTELLADGAASDDLAWTSRGDRLAFYHDDRPCVVNLDVPAQGVVSSADLVGPRDSCCRSTESVPATIASSASSAGRAIPELVSGRQWNPPLTWRARPTSCSSPRSISPASRPVSGS